MNSNGHRPAPQVRIAVDVGGTFTDVVGLEPDGRIAALKVLSTPPDFARGIETGVRALLALLEAPTTAATDFLHGATVATNAIITRTGAETGLVTTKGFRDVLETRRMRLPRLYDLRWQKPAPLVPRELRLEIGARLDPHGSVLEPLRESEVATIAHELRSAGVESVAVCLLHSYANGEQERRVREVLEREMPGCYVTLSSDLLGEIKEYDRTSTAVANAYIRPVVERYLRDMESRLDEMGIHAPILIMQSSGGLMPARRAQERPVHIIESGPAAGVTAAFHLGNRMGMPDLITLDMGGTTAKAALIEAGELTLSQEYEIGSSMSVGHRLLRGDGYLLRVPSLDIAEVGAGGGSIAWVDPGGALKVGPQSAGADPGPACYGLGGRRPTVTDADVILGWVNPDSLAGGELLIRRDLAERAVEEHVARPLGMSLVESAWGIRVVAESTLVRAVRAVSTERGRDPRRFALMAFGGMGPVHAAGLAAELGIDRVVVPLLPGLLSSVGLLFAKVEHLLVATAYLPCRPSSADRIAATLRQLSEQAVSQLAEEGFAKDEIALEAGIDVRYVGQDYAITIPLVVPVDTELVRARFDEQHSYLYGYAAKEEEVQIVAVRVTARGGAERSHVPNHLARVGERIGPRRLRSLYMGPTHGWVEAPVVSREDLHTPTPGPLVVEEDNSSTLVPIGWDAALDGFSNILLTSNGLRA